jgi:hypothetical protein
MCALRCFQAKQVALSKLTSFLAAYENPRLTALEEAFRCDSHGSQKDKVPVNKVNVINLEVY